MAYALATQNTVSKFHAETLHEFASTPRLVSHRLRERLFDLGIQIEARPFSEELSTATNVLEHHFPAHPVPVEHVGSQARYHPPSEWVDDQIALLGEESNQEICDGKRLSCAMNWQAQVRGCFFVGKAVSTPMPTYEDVTGDLARCRGPKAATSKTVGSITVGSLPSFTPSSDEL